MQNENNILITVKDLCKSYGEGDSRVAALDNVCLEIGRGELTAVLGNSGSGKSTLLNMLGGMDSFDSGSVCVDGKEIGKLNDKALTDYRKNTIGFVFQSFNLIAGLTAKENVALTAVRNKPKITEESLEIVGLADKADRYPSQLSGGQQQRVSIARALAKEPELFLCDEPTGALDYNTSKEILELIESVNQKYGNTIIMVTHNEAIQNMADHTVKLRDGVVRKNIINPNKIKAAELDW